MASDYMMSVGAVADFMGISYNSAKSFIINNLEYTNIRPEGKYRKIAVRRSVLDVFLTRNSVQGGPEPMPVKPSRGRPKKQKPTTEEMFAAAYRR